MSSTTGDVDSAKAVQNSGSSTATPLEDDTPPPLLELQDVCVSYLGHEVIHNISLSINTGEVVAIVGPSGAGKSTLLRTINFLELPSSGRILFDGREMRTGKRSQLNAHRREVGMVFQSFNLFPHLTALRNVMIGPIYSRGVSRDEAETRAHQELAHVGLSSHAHFKPAQCSGGQQQRIAIARALAMDPRIMLFDEPTSALDPELGLEVLTTMRRLADEGMTMMVVTHEMHFTKNVADRVVFMADGVIVEEGPSADVISNPQHERTQRFLSAVKDR